MKESRIWMMTLLALLAVVCATALAFVNVKLGPVIDRNERVRSERIILNVFALRYDPLDPAMIEQTYARRIAESEENGILTYTDKRSGRKAVSLTGSGFQGPIRVIAALDSDTITAFRVVSQTETPGLGTRITEDAFQRSFIGKRVGNGIHMVKSGAGESEFDAITGATETSRSLEQLLNTGFAKYFESQKNDRDGRS